MGIAEDIIIILVFGLASGYIAHRLNLPLFLGYIVAGVVIGPYTGGVSVSNTHEVELLAEIGVALLLFSIGLEVSFDELRDVKYIALAGTPLQMAATGAVGYWTARSIGFDDRSSLVMGAIASLSSTMIVMKILINRKLMGTLSSKVMLAMLIVQDLAAVPMIIIISNLNGSKSGNSGILYALLAAAIFLALIVTLGSRVIPAVFKKIAHTNSSELFMISVAATGLGVGYISYLNGLSLAFGAFAAGMVMNQTEYGHRAISDIIPLRDIFGLMFFISIGMLFDPAFFFARAGTIFYVVAVTMAAKFAIFWVVCRAFGYYNVIPLASGLCLSQIGEFSFVIATLALKANVIGREVYSIILSVAVITMFVSPFLSMLTTPLYALKKKRAAGGDSFQTYNFDPAKKGDRIVIAGGGRLGSRVSMALRELGYDSVVIEMDFKNIERLKELGCSAIFGDAALPNVLEAAGIEKSPLLIVAIPAVMISTLVIESAKAINPAIKIVARAENQDYAVELIKRGIFRPIQPDLEAGFEMVRLALIHLGMSPVSIQRFMDGFHEQNVKKLIGGEQTPAADAVRFGNAASLLRMKWVELPAGCGAVGKSIGEIDVRKKTGASIVGIYSNGQFQPNPGPSHVIGPGDLIAVIGDQDSQNRFDELMK